MQPAIQQSYQTIPNGSSVRESTTSNKSNNDDEVRRLKARVAQLESMQANTANYDTSSARVKELEDRLATVVAVG